MFEKREKCNNTNIVWLKNILSTSDGKTEVQWQTKLVVDGEFKYPEILSK